MIVNKDTPACSKFDARINHLQRTKYGKEKPNLFNAVTLLECDAALSGKISTKHLPYSSPKRQFVAITGELPWRLEEPKALREWSYTDSFEATLYLQRKYGIIFAQDTISKAVHVIALRNR